MLNKVKSIPQQIAINSLDEAKSLLQKTSKIILDKQACNKIQSNIKNISSLIIQIRKDQLSISNSAGNAPKTVMITLPEKMILLIEEKIKSGKYKNFSTAIEKYFTNNSSE